MARASNANVLHHRCYRNLVALNMLEDVAQGCADLNRNGLQHCSLQPSHLMLTHTAADSLAGRGASWCVKIAGFGSLTRLQAGAFHAKFLRAHKLGYSAPETVDDGVVTQCSDVYSFGAVIFDMFHAEDESFDDAFGKLHRRCATPLPQMRLRR